MFSSSIHLISFSSWRLASSNLCYDFVDRKLICSCTKTYRNVVHISCPADLWRLCFHVHRSICMHLPRRCQAAPYLVQLNLAYLGSFSPFPIPFCSLVVRNGSALRRHCASRKRDWYWYTWCRCYRYHDLLKVWLTTNDWSRVMGTSLGFIFHVCVPHTVLAILTLW